MKLWYFLLLLKAYLSPKVDDDFVPDDDPQPDDSDDNDPSPDDVDDDPQPDDTPEPEPDDQPAPRLSRAQKAIIDSRQRAQAAEAELARAKAELEGLRRGSNSQPAQPSADQLLWQQEEETLRNPEATDWQRYAIQANRAARAAQANSQSALQRAEDLADKTSFAALAASKPKLYEAYKDRVETMLQDLRSRGNNAPREKLLAILVGEDMLSGKLKPSKSGGAKTTAAPRASARSDVSATSGSRMSEHEKRMKRLENVRI